MALTCEEMVKKARFDLMNSNEFKLMSGVLLCGNLTVVDDVPTACTDGWNVKVGRKFFESLNQKQRAFVIAHEAFHKLLKQLRMYRQLFEQNPRLCNYAADYVVNLMITDADPSGRVTQKPEKLLWDERFRGMTTKQVYDILKQEGGGKGKGEAGGGSGGKGECLDDHDWEGAGEVSEKEQEVRDFQIQQAVRQGMMIGNRSAGLARVMDEVVAVEIDWRDQIADFVKTNVVKGKDDNTWRRPNRRFLHSGRYCPSSESEEMGEIVCAIDTSGSIGGYELAEFAALMEQLCGQVNPSRLRLIWWDCEMQGEQVFESGEYEGMRNTLKPKGGGGTDPTCVFDHIKKEEIKPEVIVFLTDGYVSWPEAGITSYPVLWGITSDQQAPWGITVRVRGE